MGAFHIGGLFAYFLEQLVNVATFWHVCTAIIGINLNSKAFLAKLRINNRFARKLLLLFHAITSEFQVMMQRLPGK